MGSEPATARGAVHALNYVKDTITGDWVEETQPGGSGGGGTSSTFGAAFPATGTAVGAKDSTGANMVPLNLDAAGFLKVNVAAGGAGGGAMTVADGADVAEGATTDAAVITDVAGTISGKLRGLIKWAFERMPASLGQKLMALSFPVTIASDQTRFPISVQDFNSGSNLGIDVTGAARTRLFDSNGDDVVVADGHALGVTNGIAALNNDGANLHILKGDTDGTTQFNLTKVGGAALTEGQKAMAASVPVVIASDQSALPVTAAALPLPAGAATSANQATEITRLTSIDGKLPAAAALADNLANPTTTEVGANLLGWDAAGSVWRRVQVAGGTGDLRIDGSGHTQPVSGVVTANQGSPGATPWPINFGDRGNNTFAWNSATAVDNVFSFATNRNYGTIVLSVNPDATISGGGFIFEGSTDGVDWYPIRLTRMDTFVAETTYQFIGGKKQLWMVNLGALLQFRVRLNPIITGTGQVNFGILVTAAPADPAVVVGGTVSTANGALETGNLASLLLLHQTQLIAALQDIRMELRIHSALIANGLNVTDNVDTYRNDPYYFN